MTALRMRARAFLSEQALFEVRRRVTSKSVALIAHAWVLITRRRSRWSPCGRIP